MTMHTSEIHREFHSNKRVIAMAGTKMVNSMSRLYGVLALSVVILGSLAGPVLAADVVTTHKSDSGWTLRVNGSDYFIKGVVWGYSPRGQNYSYNLWGESDEYIREVLDYDFGLMAAANINTIRSFAMIPPKWVTYIFREHGIRTVINPLMGRYGYNVGGRWVPFTDYSDSLTRATLKADMLEIVDKYKDVPGVIMFAFGNESNYGLSWSSFEIENLPEGEQNTAKARYLYSLFNEVIKDGKTIAPNVPFTIVNGDIQYIDLIAELVPDLDLLGTNVYRGPSFTSLWADVEEKLDLPVLMFEFGSDAFNAREFREDQLAQATVLKDQWQEMYNQAAGNGGAGNSIGGFVFEWRDEWWKYLQEENLDVQDNHASWSNQAYLFDWAEGQNNMNEEWFGITALGTPNADGVYTAIPRMAYDVLAQVWALDPYSYKKAAYNEAIDNINMEYLELKADVRQLKNENEEKREMLQFTGGSLRGEFVYRGNDLSITEDGEEGFEFSDGEMIFLDFAFQPTDQIEGYFSINVLGNVARKRPLEFTYGDRGLSYSLEADPVTSDETLPVKLVVSDNERVEIYDFNAKYEGENVDITAFYHTPRFHWGYEGDFFGLVHEATDILGMDIWNAKAPSGMEFAGKNKWGGFKLVFGPEIYWGANPKWVLKYDFELGNIDWSFMHSEDVARSNEGADATQATQRQSRATTLTALKEFSNDWILEVGGIISATEKVDETYTYVDSNGDVFLDQIDFEDTLGFRAKLTFPLLGTDSYVMASQGGLVADGGQYLKVFGVNDPSVLPYSMKGNKREYEAGMMMNYGNLMIFPRFLWRENLVDANPFIPPSIGPGGVLDPGAIPRNTDADPFAVLDNREAKAGEVFFTYDPTGATQFYSWDNEWREDAKFAFDIGGGYTELSTSTDAYLFFFEPTGQNASFGIGLPPEDVWTLSSRMVFNPAPGQRYIAKVVRGFNQSTGDPVGGTRKYWQLYGTAIFGNRHRLSGWYLQDSWGPYDFYRQFNITFPEQVQLDYSVLLGKNANAFRSAVALDATTKVGIRMLYRTNDENSPADEFLNGDNDYSFMTVLYFTYQF